MSVGEPKTQSELRVTVGSVMSALGGTAFGGFLAALAVHVMTVRGVDVSSRVPLVWALQFGVVVVGAGLLYTNRFFLKRFRLREMMDHLPIWTGFLLAIVFAYVLLNVFVCSPVLDHGNADLQDGHYVLVHGYAITPLRESEYHVHRTYQRLFSGFWMLFYLATSICALFWREQPRSSGLLVT